MSGVAATILAVVALPINIIGLAIPFWEYYGTALGSAYTGLWQVCLSFGGHSACGEIGSHATDSLNAVRAMEILGMLGLAVALLLGVIKLCNKSDKLVFFVAAGCLAIAAGCLMIVGCIIYGEKTQKELDPTGVRGLHAGFGMCIVSAILSIIAGVLYIADRRRNANSQPGQIFSGGQAGQIITGAQPGSVPYQVQYDPGAAYNVGRPGTVISAPATGGYPVAAYSTGPAGANVPMTYK